MCGLEHYREKTVLGWREWVWLPTFDLPPILAKVDTGARTSALHAFAIEPYLSHGAPWLCFQVHPLQRNTQVVHTCHAPVIDRRMVTDSGGHRQRRYVIQSAVRMNERQWNIELTLTARDTMRFRLLLGRTALRGNFIVDPELSYCFGKRPRQLDRPMP